jgi:hypothetical protein
LCEKAELPIDAYFKASSIMLKGAVLKHYYITCKTDLRMTQLTDLCSSIQSTFKGAECDGEDQAKAQRYNEV